MLSDEDKAIKFLMSVKAEVIEAALGICALPEKELFQRLEKLYMKGVDAGVTLGVERARKVKPLVWRRSDNRDGGFALFCKRYAVTNYKLDKGLIYYETEPFKRQSAESVDEAIAACQKHHDELVLSQLEQP